MSHFCASPLPHIIWPLSLSHLHRALVRIIPVSHVPPPLHTGPSGDKYVSGGMFTLVALILENYLVSQLHKTSPALPVPHARPRPQDSWGSQTQAISSKPPPPPPTEDSWLLTTFDTQKYFDCCGLQACPQPCMCPHRRQFDRFGHLSCRNSASVSPPTTQRTKCGRPNGGSRGWGSPEIRRMAVCFYFYFVYFVLFVV